MKKNLSIIILSFCLLSVACSGSKKQSLEEEKKKEETAVAADIPAQLVIDTVAPKQGIKYKEIRKVDPANPPVTINLEGTQEKKVFDLADYYSSVKYVVLDFPHKDEFPGFFGDAKFTVTYETNMMSGSGLNSEITLLDKAIIAGDAYLGYYQYDDSGTFVTDVAKPKEYPDYDKTKNSIDVERTPESEFFIGKAQAYGDMLIVSDVKAQKAYANYYSISNRRMYHTALIRMGIPIPINGKEMMSYNYRPVELEQKPIMYSYAINGDTLCRFMNYNPLNPKQITRAYTNPEGVDMFYYGGKLNVRQAYNDTVYSFKSSNELTPRYVLSYKQHKPSIETALTGNKAGKYFIYSLKETDRFLYIVYTVNYDCPNNRKDGSVKFYYSLYDKNDKKIYRVEESKFPEDWNKFPEDMLFNNSIPDGIPINLSRAKTSGNKLYVGYSKSQLKKIIDSKDFSTYSTEQQQKMESLYADMPDGSLLAIIIE
ncbi:DUF4933 domain-containing protein [Dysgonomonas sp. 25]|uniref:DUF4933 domain-containing protein n=1 Tax=Dysgonomonas sp. 25 TaxID=2302933 RepID=UPI0013D7FB3C|nr:DUF4933 domain-containing protein [Dysgonomonas sp. 25]NDV68831.1 DUF4933 domain-containing protein [Dysgonomonas sp. 25]